MACWPQADKQSGATQALGRRLPRFAEQRWQHRGRAKIHGRHTRPKEGHGRLCSGFCGGHPISCWLIIASRPWPGLARHGGVAWASAARRSGQPRFMQWESRLDLITERARRADSAAAAEPCRCSTHGESGQLMEGSCAGVLCSSRTLNWSSRARGQAAACEQKARTASGENVVERPDAAARDDRSWC